jgi:hypothetical protein
MAVHKEDGSRETRINIYDASNTQGASAAKWRETGTGDCWVAGSGWYFTDE